MPNRPRPARLRAAAALLAAAALAPAAARAQAPAPAGPRDIADQTNAWLMYFGDHAVARRWAVHAEAQVRRSDGAAGLRGWQQLLLRPGAIYTVAPNARVTAGYAFIDTWPYGEQPAAARFPEHRLWQQLQLGHATGRVAWQHRYRVEQRWVERPLDAAGARDRTYSNRARYLVRATVPLRGRTLDVRELYVSAYDELFASWGRNVGRNALDQNRLYGALGWRLGATTRVEGGYLQQLILKPDGVRVERNHTLQLAVFQNAPFVR
jgi:hypothetical protein